MYLEDGSRLLRNLHHLWFPRLNFDADGLAGLFRNISPSVTPIWYDAHAVIHGSLPEIYQPLYLAPVMPDEATMRSYIGQQLSRRLQHHQTWRQIDSTREPVTIFELADSSSKVTYSEPCVQIYLDKAMLQIVQKCYVRNPYANEAKIVEYLQNRHELNLCTCSYATSIKRLPIENNIAA